MAFYQRWSWCSNKFYNRIQLISIYAYGCDTNIDSYSLYIWSYYSNSSYHWNIDECLAILDSLCQNNTK